LEEHSAVFPPYYCGILRSSELTGQLDISLDQLSTYIERDLDAKSKIKSAMIYPAVIAMMSVATAVILTVFVLPRFTKFFEDLDAKLPLPTRMLLGASDMTQKFWFVWVGMLIATVVAIYWLQKNPKGRMVRDKIFLRIPLIKQVVLCAVVERTCRIIAAMACRSRRRSRRRCRARTTRCSSKA
jgi:type IV pilus assembly protein PilC